MIYSKIGGGDLQRGLSAPSSPKQPTAKFWCDAHVRTNAQIKFLFYPPLGSVKRANSLFKNESVQKNKPAHFQLTSCNGEAISTEFITDCCVGFKMMQNSIPSYNARLPHVINPFVLGTYWVHYLHTVLFFYFCVAFSLPKKFINLHAILGAHLWIGLNLLKACPFLFTLYACLGNYADIWARASKI